MAKKTIGIPGWKLGDGSFGATITYLDFISKFGNPRILMPTDNGVQCDVLLLPGGPDVEPSAFGQAPGYWTSNPCVHRQGFYNRELKSYVDAKVPIFGICLGFQMLNTFFGGSLTQNFRYHAQSEKRYETAHPINIITNGIYTHPKSKKPYEVNSHHHQGVVFSDLSRENFDHLAYAYNEDSSTTNNDAIVEAFMHKKLPIAGVQWHPEELHDDFAIALFKHIIKQAS